MTRRLAPASQTHLGRSCKGQWELQGVLSFPLPLWPVMVHMVEAPTAQVSKWSHAADCPGNPWCSHVFKAYKDTNTTSGLETALSTDVYVSWMKATGFHESYHLCLCWLQDKGCLPSTNAWKFLTFFRNTCLRVDFNVWMFRMFSDISFKD